MGRKLVDATNACRNRFTRGEAARRLLALEVRALEVLVFEVREGCLAVVLWAELEAGFVAAPLWPLESACAGFAAGEFA
jgi:hypothetical protein